MTAGTNTKPSLVLDAARIRKPVTRVQSLDCMRAIACLLVILSHTCEITSPGGYTLGILGVACFCVLSGYLITSILVEEETSFQFIDAVKFLQRRFLRIVPVYFLVVLSCTILLKTGLFLKNHPDFVAAGLLNLEYYATFTQNSDNGFVLNHLWSISVEEQFYCLLPLLLLVVKRPVARQIVLIAGALALTRFLNQNDYLMAAFIPLIFGCLLALNLNRVTRLLERFGTVTLMALVCLLLSASWLTGDCLFAPLSSVAFSILTWVCVFRFQPHPILKPVAYLGQISYGIYLFHMPIRLVSLWMLDRLGITNLGLLPFALTTFMSVGLASISWEFFERPILGLRKYIEHNRVGTIIAFITPVLICIGLFLHSRGS